MVKQLHAALVLWLRPSLVFQRLDAHSTTFYLLDLFVRVVVKQRAPAEEGGEEQGKFWRESV